MSLHQFNASRISALDTYTELEHFLADTLQAILRCRPDAAYTIFFRVTNTRARYAIISDLLKIHYGDLFNHSWNKFEKWMGSFDTSRNQLTHWSTLREVDKAGMRWVLRNPVGYFVNKPGSADYTIASMQQLRTSMVHMGNVLMRFAMCLTQGPESALWKIFQQPVAHQNPTEFLEHLIDAERQAQTEPHQG